MRGASERVGGVLRIGGWILGAMIATGCDADRVTLAIDLRTDFSVPQEITEAITELRDPSGAMIERRTVSLDAMDDPIAGVRLAELDVAPGDYLVTTSLRDPAGTMVGSRDVLATVRRATAITVVITRNCRGVECPASDPLATECLGGVCVRPECSPQTAELCPEPACGADDECPAGPFACLRPVCLGGGCGLRADSSMCEPEQRCDPTVGCVGETIVDAGASDAGRADGGTALGSGLVTLSGSFGSCPRTPPFCVTLRGDAFVVVDPQDGSTCTGPSLVFDPAHAEDGAPDPLYAFALIEDDIYLCGTNGTSDAWGYHVDMARGVVEDGLLGDVTRCISMFRDGARIGVGAGAEVSSYATWRDVLTDVPMGTLGAPIGRCSGGLGGTLQWDVLGGTFYGGWFTGTDLETCDIATGDRDSIELVGFDARIDGVAVGSEIVVLSRNVLHFFSSTGAPLRTVPLTPSGTYRSLECAF